MALPIPGGAGAAIKGYRAANVVADVVTHADEVYDVVKYADEVSEGANVGSNFIFGSWGRIDEVQDARVVGQEKENWCVLACSEMLTGGTYSQEFLSSQIAMFPGGTSAELAANGLNRLDPGAWSGGFVGHSNFDALNSRGLWGAEMDIGNGKFHMILVEGVTDSGLVKVMDPGTATSYKIDYDEFMKAWNGNALYGN